MHHSLNLFIYLCPSICVHQSLYLSLISITQGVTKRVGECKTKNPSFIEGLTVSSAESERFELSQDCYTLTDQQSAALPLCQLSIAEDEGLEPPRPRGRRFSRPVSYQLELILQILLENVFNKCKRLLARWENYYGIISPYKKQIKILLFLQISYRAEKQYASLLPP